MAHAEDHQAISFQSEHHFQSSKNGPDFAPVNSSGQDASFLPNHSSFLSLPHSDSFPALESQLEVSLHWEILTEEARSEGWGYPLHVLSQQSLHLYPFKAQFCSVDWAPPEG